MLLAVCSISAQYKGWEGGNFHILDDFFLKSGYVTNFGWETADGNANALILALPEGTATDVPVFVVGDASILNQNLGWFDGIAEPSVAYVDDDMDSYILVGHYSDDLPTLRSSGSFSIMTNDVDDYVKWSTSGNLPQLSAIGGADVTDALKFLTDDGDILVAPADNLDLQPVAGDVDIDAVATKDVDIAGGQVLISSKDNVASAVAVTVNQGVSETIVFTNTQGTAEGAIELTSTAGGLDVNVATGKNIDFVGGQFIFLSNEDVASAVSFRTNTGISETMVFTNTQGTDAAAIGFTASAGGITHTSEALVVTQNAGAIGDVASLTVTGGALTALTAATEVVGINFNQSANKTWAAGAGPLASQREVVIQAPTYIGDVGSALTMTKASTFVITGSPTAGANMTITAPYALEVTTGISGFGGNLVPLTSDGAALGTTSLMFSDLMLASGAVINFNAGDITATHSASLLSFAGGEYKFDDNVYLYSAVNDGDPYVNIGSAVAEALQIKADYAAGTQTLQNLDFITYTASATANYGQFRFYVDEALEFTINDDGVIVAGDVTISGDDLFMATNTTGYILRADNTNYNPVKFDDSADLAGFLDDETGTLLVVFSGSPTFTTDIEVRKDDIKVTQSDSYGVTLSNTQAATATDSIQYSPPVIWQGYGWKTDATAASQKVEFRSYLQPIEGTAAPTGDLVIEVSINDGAYSEVFELKSNGNIKTPGTIQSPWYQVASTADNTETVTHNFGYRPFVWIYVTATEVNMEAEIDHTDANTFVVTTEDVVNFTVNYR